MNYVSYFSNFLNGLVPEIESIFNFIAQNSSGSDKLVASTVAAANGNAESAYRLEKLSPYMCEAISKASGEAVIGGMEFVSDYGSVVAVAAYASGNVELGVAIDGITTFCDISLDVLSACKTGNVKEAVSSISKSLIVNAISSSAAEQIIKRKIPNKTMEAIEKSLTDVFSVGIETILSLVENNEE